MTVSFPLDLMGQMLGEFSRGLSVTVWLASRGTDRFCQDYLFNAQIALEDRDSGSLRSRGQIYFLSSIVKMCLSRAKIIQVFLQLLKKDWGFLSLIQCVHNIHLGCFALLLCLGRARGTDVTLSCTAGCVMSIKVDLSLTHICKYSWTVAC